MTPEYGAATQLEKIDMLDFADLIALNKFDKKGGLDALRDVKKQFQRNHHLWEEPVESMPVFGTIASQFNDIGTNQLFHALMKTVLAKTKIKLSENPKKNVIIAEQQRPSGIKYLAFDLSLR